VGEPASIGVGGDPIVKQAYDRKSIYPRKRPLDSLKLELPKMRREVMRTNKLVFVAVSMAISAGCSGSATQSDPTRTSSLRLTVDASSTVAPLPPQPAFGSTLQRLPGDPKKYTQEELVRAGYLMRPDPVNAPSAYATWLKMVSSPVKLVGPGDGTPTHLFHNNPTTSTDFYNQCGQIMDLPSGAFIPFIGAYGAWSVPTVSNNLYSDTYSSIWVGLGGPSPQCGAEMDAQAGSGTTYYAWYENPASDPAGVGSTKVNSLTVNPGDFFQAELYPGDANGNADTQGTVIWYDMCSGYVTCTGWFQGRFANNPAKLNFSEVDFILERPTLADGRYSLLADFGQANFTYWDGIYWDGTSLNGSWSNGQYNEPFLQVSMVSTAPQAYNLCPFSNGGTSNGIYMTWDGFQ
jgi:hypothetical protein